MGGVRPVYFALSEGGRGRSGISTSGDTATLAADVLAGVLSVARLGPIRGTSVSPGAVRPNHSEEGRLVRALVGLTHGGGAGASGLRPDTVARVVDGTPRGQRLPPATSRVALTYGRGQMGAASNTRTAEDFLLYPSRRALAARCGSVLVPIPLLALGMTKKSVDKRYIQIIYSI